MFFLRFRSVKISFAPTAVIDQFKGNNPPPPNKTFLKIRGVGRCSTPWSKFKNYFDSKHLIY